MTRRPVGDLLQSASPVRGSAICAIRATLRPQETGACARPARLRAPLIERCESADEARAPRRCLRKGGVMKRHRTEGRWDRKVAFAVALLFAAAFAATPAAARADDAPGCPVSPASAYTMQLRALTGPAGADLTVSVVAKAGCALPDVFTNIRVRTFGANGALVRTQNLVGVGAPHGVANEIALGRVPRHRRVVADVTFDTGSPARTYSLHGAVRTLLRPDLVVEEITRSKLSPGGPSPLLLSSPRPTAMSAPPRRSRCPRFRGPWSASSFLREAESPFDSPRCRSRQPRRSE